MKINLPVEIKYRYNYYNRAFGKTYYTLSGRKGMGREIGFNGGEKDEKVPLLWGRDQGRSD
jgi:hypothetical protein